MTAAERRERTEAADALCAAAFVQSGAAERGIALVAVGSLARGELAPHSDLDLVLVHADEVDPGPCAERLWYPFWDSGRRLDHAVRSVSQTRALAADDLRVALGMLDVRHLAGDPVLSATLRSSLLSAWRRDARRRLPELHRLAEARARLLGELAHASVPDLKESLGGLRDATVLRALRATWVVDVPHKELERWHRALLDVRDVCHDGAHRTSDRVAPDGWSDLAGGLGLADAEEAQRHVREIGRHLNQLSRLTWRRVEGALAPGRSGPRRPELQPVAPGIALSAGEVVLDFGARPERDPLLVLCAAAEAAERGVALAPATAARLVRECPPLPEPWPAPARSLFVRLLASGPGLLPVWEALDESGALDRMLPEWERLRLLPHASPIHRFTVDRHLVETCIEAAGLIRRIPRPDVVLVAALLHDVGKAEPTEHARAGAPIARRAALRLGFSAGDADLVATLVRWHLLLPDVATTRDPEDPATVTGVVAAVGTAGVLAMLSVLTEADARATSPQAWSSWRAGLVGALVERVAVALTTQPPEPVRAALGPRAAG
ncbi:MAG: [protein-PII] uridylyltransferase [Nocardioidaceae bacterium]